MARETKKPSKQRDRKKAKKGLKKSCKNTKQKQKQKTVFFAEKRFFGELDISKKGSEIKFSSSGCLFHFLLSGNYRQRQQQQQQKIETFVIRKNFAVLDISQERKKRRDGRKSDEIGDFANE